MKQSFRFMHRPFSYCRIDIINIILFPEPISGIQRFRQMIQEHKVGKYIPISEFRNFGKTYENGYFPKLKI